MKVLSEPIDISDIVKGLGLNDPNIHNVNPARDLRRHMLALMNCVYETQNVNLFTGIKLPMCELQSKHYNFTLNEQVLMVSLQFLGMLLYPTDCLAIGYFLRHANNNNSCIFFLVDFKGSLLGEMEFKALAVELQKTTKNYVSLNLLGVYISSRAIGSLMSADSFIAGLDVDCNLVEDEALLLKYCIEGFSKPTSFLKELGLGSSHCIYYLILILQCLCLSTLVLSRNLLFPDHSATLLFFEALKYSHLKSLALHECGIDDDTLKLLMAAVCHEGCAVEILSFYSNLFSEHGLTSSLEPLLNSPFVRLRRISVDNVSHDHDELLKSINDIHDLYCQRRLIVQEYLLKHKEEERISGTAMLNYYALLRPDLAFQSLHH